MSLRVEAILCRTDNYAYLIVDAAQREVWVVDPSRAEPVRSAIDRLGATLRGIVLTHHHLDHVEGVESLLASSGAPRPWVAAHPDNHVRISGLTHLVAAGRDGFTACELQVAGLALEAMHVPGHTLDALAWKLGEEVFTGDTLFAAGCGRLFEGTAEQLWRSLRALTDGPPERRLWFGHEYTAANLRFAVAVRPEDPRLARRIAELVTPSTPTTIALEQATNVFVQAKDLAEFSDLRRRKDAFRG